MSKILQPGNYALKEGEKTPDELPDDVVGQITIQFQRNRQTRWKGEGNFFHSDAVNLLELIKQYYLAQQMQSAVQNAMRNAQRQVCLPDGSLPPR